MYKASFSRIAFMLFILGGLFSLTIFPQTNTYPWPSNGNIGIGTTSPEDKLHVNGTIRIRGSNTPYLTLAPDGAYTWWHLQNDKGKLSFSTGATPQIPILSMHPAGYVGIGTAFPSKNLDVRGNMIVVGNRFSQNGDQAIIYLGDVWDDIRSEYGFGLRLNVAGAPDNFVIRNNTGSVGIGTLNPETKTDIRGTLSIQNIAGVPTDDIVIKRPGVLSANNVRFVVSERETNKDLFIYGYDGTTYKNFIGFNYPNKQITMLDNKFRIDSTGDMRLDGKLTAKEIQVKTNVWSDFVFKSSYQLRKLEEVESFIKEKGHLPDIPTETEVKANGVEVGAMQAKLLQKVEELTLYMIEQDKKIAEISQENRNLKSLLSTLK